ncbi:MAG: GIY-YIG nuclease family protein [Acidobacteriota bacterium]
MGRVRKLLQNSNLNDETLSEALYRTQNSYRKEHSVRKTWVKIEGQRVDLHSLYIRLKDKAAVSYRVFWSRVRRNNSIPLDSERVEHALSLSESEWISFYGGGRHRNFVYLGDLYPELHGRSFHGISALLREVNRYSERSTIWSRLKAGWGLDTALSVPVSFATDRKGLIYKITRISTGQVYVGLTHGSLEQRWLFHTIAARNGATSQLAAAIRQDGSEGFIREVIEAGIDDAEVLSERERFWVETLAALGPAGLNTAKPGALGIRRGIATEVEGEEFRSITEAAHTIGNRKGLAPHVVASRLRTGQPIPNHARKKSKHPEAGSNLFRRWLALVRRHPHSVVASWLQNYDSFKADVGVSFLPGLQLVRIELRQPWGPGNTQWVTAQQKLEAIRGKRMVVHGVEFPSIKSVADAHAIGVSTLKDRLQRQGMSLEAAVELDLGQTSYRKRSGMEVDGRKFQSMRQAILYVASKRGISESQARSLLKKAGLI